jgi:hypothetical protein
MDAYPIKISAYNLLYKFYQNVAWEKPINKAIVISGVTRGGTTWLMEMLYTMNMQIVWEPTKYETLNHHHGASFAKELGIIPYIPVDAVWDEAYYYFDKLLKGLEPIDIDKNSHPLLLSNPFNKDRLILKFCNINLLLPWLCRNFDIRPIVLIRNPMAVIASQLQHKGFSEIGTKYNLFKLNQPRYKIIFEKYDDQIAAIDSQVSMLANWWAIQHVELFNCSEKERKWEIICFDELLEKNRFCIGEIQNKYKINKDLDRLDYKIPSATSNKLLHIDNIPKTNCGNLY